MAGGAVAPFPRALFLLLSLCWLLATLSRGDLDVDRAVLLALYNATDGPSWTDNTGWSVDDDDLSSWYGVTVNGTSFVSKLDLDTNNLKGQIPVEIGNLTGIREIVLSTNFLSGPIPAELGKVSTLTVLHLEENTFSGPFPSELTDMEALTGLWLYSNKLEGDLPTEIGDFNALETLNIRDNRFTGGLPTHLGNLTTCRYLNIAENILTGPIPEEIETLVTHHSLGSATSSLLLQSNYLTGTVPSGISEGTVPFLDLSDNLLTNWPDQRDETATAPPQTSSLATPAPMPTDADSSSSAGDTSTPRSPSPSPTAADDSFAVDQSPAPVTGGAVPVTPPPSTSTPLSSSPSSSSSSSTSSVELAGIVVGAVGGLAILAGILAFCFARPRRTRSSSENDASLAAKTVTSSSSVRSGFFLAVEEENGDESDDGDSKESGAVEAGEAGGGGMLHMNPLSHKNAYKQGSSSNGTMAKALAPSEASLPSFHRSKDNDDDATSRTRNASPEASDGVDGKRKEDTTTTSVDGGSGGGGGGVADGVAASMLDIAFAVMAAAEEVGQQSLIPGVREAATVVAGLVRLAADHRSNAGSMERRVRWCRSIVLTLERAGEVLGKAKDRDGEAEQILLEDVQESIEDMLQIMRSYKNKNMVSKIFVSTLCKRRQDEAETAINSAVQRLQLGLHVHVGHKLESVGQAVEEGLQMQRRVSEESRAESRKKRRRHRLDQLEIPAAEVEITDEVLGRGGFGTVYLADFNGLNAAAKVIVFDNDQLSDNDHDDIDNDQDDDDVGVGDDSYRFLKERRKMAATGSDHGGPSGEGGPLPSQGKGTRNARSEDRQRNAFMRELEAMKRLRGPHTVQIYGAVTSCEGRLVLVMELLAGGDLRYRLRKAKKPLDEGTLRGIVKDVCSGMAFLHSKKTVHGDLKSANVLFDGAGRAKIADFGTSLWTQHTTRLATYSTRPQESVGMSLPWAAPEVLNRQGSSFKTDVYSFGMVLLECLTRKVPWQDEVAGVDMLLLAVTSGDRPTIPPDTPVDLASKTKACWAHDPAARPEFKALLSDLSNNGGDANIDAGLPSAADVGARAEEVARGGNSEDGPREVWNRSFSQVQRRQGGE